MWGVGGVVGIIRRVVGYVGCGVRRIAAGSFCSGVCSLRSALALSRSLFLSLALILSLCLTLILGWSLILSLCSTLRLLLCVSFAFRLRLALSVALSAFVLFLLFRLVEAADIGIGQEVDGL